ncbi:MAG: ABC transporter ATP-binding protein [Acholeplasmataceae bacterium]|nr:ABC transporter ATP-binding protein [Acholeplasmataceae bacterium]
MINVKNINKSFGEIHVLKDINLTLEKGSIFGLVGINGAGKSTFLRLLSGVLIPESGAIEVDEVLLGTDQGIRKNIFYLSDQPVHSLHMTIKDLKEIYKVFYHFDDEKFASILKLFNLRESMSLNHISKGMKRQAYIAAAFASNAKYLLLDEVFDGLDPIARLKFKKLMIDSSSEEKIFILTSHSLRELEDICDSFGIIDEGYFKRFGHLANEISKIKKYQVILKDKEPYQINKDTFNLIYHQQDGRVLTIIIEGTHPSLEETLNSNDFHVIDELPISFEEYFMVYQGGENK